MTPTHSTLLVARREVRERLRSRVFLASSAFMALIVVGVVVLSAVTGDDQPETVDIGVATAEDRAIAATAGTGAEAFDLRVETRAVDTAAARAAVRDGRVDLALAGGRLVVGADTRDEAVALVQASARDVRSRARLRAEGLAPERVERALDPPPLDVVDVDEAGGGGEGLAALSSFLLYFALFSFGYAVSSGVVEEKSSRVVEVVLSTIRPAQLLAGKVLGIGAVGLLQLVGTGGIGLAVALGSGELDLPPATASTAALVALWFVLGYLLYACAFAVAGALVSRQEDAQSTTTPLMVVLIAGYFASVAAADDPSSTLAHVCTFLPPVAPMIVPARAAQDALPAWELALSIALMVAATLLLIRLAARIYSRSVLHVGAPLRPADAVRLARR